MSIRPTPRTRPLLFVFLAVLLATSLCAMAAATPALAEGEATAKDGVSALGRIEPEHGVIALGASSLVNAVSGAVVAELLVEAGDAVTKGQLLAVTNTAEVEGAEVQVRTAELEVAQREAEAALGEEQDVCSRADVAQRTSVRRTNLRKSGVASDEEADVAAGDAKALSGSCRAARLATKAADADIDVARARLAKSSAELERCRVRAPADGRVLRIVTRPGEMLGLEPLLEIAQVEKMYAIAEVYETDIRRVRKGQKATVTSPALDAELTGVVETIRPLVRKQDVTGTDPAAHKDARIIEVEVLLDQPDRVATLTNLQVEVVLHP